MPKSDASWPGSLRLIGDLERRDHHHLSADDECYFLGAYTAGAGYDYSSTNNLVQNLKKPMARQGTPQWSHKLNAIREAAKSLRAAMNPAFVEASVIVPIPPSALKGTAAYDDRMVQVARGLHPAADVRELLVASAAREPRHMGTQRRDIEELRRTISIDASLSMPVPQQVILLDDVLTTGCSFRAAEILLREVWPTVPIYGIFIARVARDHVDLSGFTDF